MVIKIYQYAAFINSSEVYVVTKIYPYTDSNLTDEGQNYTPQDNSSSNGTVAHGCRQ